MARLVLILAALEIFGVGFLYLVAPGWMTAANGSPAVTVMQLHAARAAYGGVFVAFGGLFAAGALREDLRRVALWALATFMGGFALGRIASLVVDGWPATTLLAALGSELAFFAAALWLLRRRGASAAA